MVQQNIVFLAFKILAYDSIKDIIRFPVWWYSHGLKMVWHIFTNSLRSGEEYLGVSIWIKNIWRPMYGQYDVTGRIISVLVRIVQIIIRTALFTIWIVVSFFVILFWILFPLLAVSQIVYQFSFFLA